jgi:hypothetical protein
MAFADVVFLGFTDNNKYKLKMESAVQASLDIRELCQSKFHHALYKCPSHMYYKIEQACEYQFHSFIEYIVVDPMHRNHVLQYATKYKNLYLVQWALQRDTQYLDIGNALYKATSDYVDASGDLDIVLVLHSHIVDNPNILSRFKDLASYLAITLDSCTRTSKSVHKETIMNLSMIKKSDIPNDKYMKFACKHGVLSVVQEYMYKVKVMEEYLTSACMYNQVAIVKCLLQYDAYKYFLNDALSVSCTFGHLDLIPFLLEKTGYSRASCILGLLPAYLCHHQHVLDYLRLILCEKHGETREPVTIIAHEAWTVNVLTCAHLGTKIKCFDCYSPVIGRCVWYARRIIARSDYTMSREEFLSLLATNNTSNIIQYVIDKKWCLPAPEWEDILDCICAHESYDCVRALLYHTKHTQGVVARFEDIEYELVFSIFAEKARQESGDTLLIFKELEKYAKDKSKCFTEYNFHSACMYYSIQVVQYFFDGIIELLGESVRDQYLDLGLYHASNAGNLNVVIHFYTEIASKRQDSNRLRSVMHTLLLCNSSSVYSHGYVLEFLLSREAAYLPLAIRVTKERGHDSLHAYLQLMAQKCDL